MYSASPFQSAVADIDGLSEAVKRLRDGLSPEAIFLYGSHAYGEPHEDSDVDLLIVVEEPDSPSYELEAEAYHLLSGLRFPAEIRVVSRQEFQKRARWLSTVEREVHERGIQLYAAS